MNKEWVMALKNPVNWKPNVSKIATELGLSTSATSEFIKRHSKEISLEIRILGPEDLYGGKQ